MRSVPQETGQPHVGDMPVGHLETNQVSTLSSFLFFGLGDGIEHQIEEQNTSG